MNISPFEIDEILMNMPGIHAGIAVGFENDWYGEEVGAFVKVKDGMELTEQQILTYCRRHLPFSKSPKVVVFGDVVPVTSTGKYQRTLCKELFGKWKTVQFSENLAAHGAWVLKQHIRTHHSRNRIAIASMALECPQENPSVHHPSFPCHV